MVVVVKVQGNLNANYDHYILFRIITQNDVMMSAVEIMPR